MDISQNSQENTCVRVNVIKKETLGQVFSCEFCEISENTFLQNVSGRLLLYREVSVGAIQERS